MGKRDPYLVERDLARYRHLQPHLFPGFEATPDLKRGDTRLAAEVSMTIILGTFIPPDQSRGFEAARLRAYETLRILAKG